MKNLLYFLLGFVLVTSFSLQYCYPSTNFCTDNNSCLFFRVRDLNGPVYTDNNAYSPIYRESCNFFLDPSESTTYSNGWKYFSFYVYQWDGSTWIVHQSIVNIDIPLELIDSLMALGTDANPNVLFPDGPPSGCSSSDPPIDCSSLANTTEWSTGNSGRLHYGDDVCSDGCKGTLGGTIYFPSTDTTSGFVTFDGTDCTGPTDAIIDAIDCTDLRSYCNDLCRGNLDGFQCNESSYTCGCPDIAPAFPLIKTDDGVFPDQDEDGIPSGSDTDVDGDGTLNGSDSDVDGDGTDNIFDGDIDGDGIGNGGSTDSWTPDGGNSSGLGADPDIDGDGTPNGSDSDVDGDGWENSLDYDIDADGWGNDQDADSDGDGIPDASDSDADGDGLENYNDLSPDGTISDSDGDGLGDGQEEEEQDPPVYEFDDESGISWEPITSASSVMATKFPVSLVSNLVNVVQLLSAPGEAPKFVMSFLGGDTSMTVDLSIFDPLVIIIRWLFKIALTIGTLLFILKQWN